MSTTKRKTARKRKAKYHVGRIPVSQIEFIRNLRTDDVNEIQATFKKEFGKLLKTETIAKYRSGVNASSNREFTVTINKDGKEYSLNEFFTMKMQNSFDENMTYVIDNVYRQLRDGIS